MTNQNHRIAKEHSTIWPHTQKKRECIMHPRFFTVVKLLKLMTLSAIEGVALFFRLLAAGYFELRVG